MAMVLTLIGLSLVLTVVTAVLLSSVLQTAETAEQPQLDSIRVVGPQQFFEDSVRRSVPTVRSAVPLEMLLLQIDQHVRLEQAAAESFHRYPTVESLHRHTTSPLMH